VRVGGATGGGSGAEGNGTGATGTGQSGSQASATNPDSEGIYVPGADQTQRTGIAGQAAPEQTSGVSGKAGEGEANSQRPAGPGLGQFVTIHTPYTQVLGQYAKEATQALDREYIPSDAKDYVRTYFTELAK